VGEYYLTDRTTLHRFIQKELDRNDPAFAPLRARHFFYEDGETSPLHLLATKYRTKQAPLADFTGLHMIVPTLRCNTSCTYCQVSHKNTSASACDMTNETADRAVDFMFKSPSSHLKLEFQGGEPLLNFDMVRYIVERTREAFPCPKRLLMNTLGKDSNRSS
jgi:sulfatase maturation enzyme AslB (radical SAM superfamily)